MAIINSPKLMAIINLTPDSFSHDGISSLEELQQHKAIENVLNSKPDIIDIGAESSRPGSKPVDFDTEWSRLAVCLKYLNKKKNKSQIPAISIDSTKIRIFKNASQLVTVDFINSIEGRVTPEIAKVAKDLNAKLILMHNNAKEVDKSYPGVPIFTGYDDDNFFNNFINEAKVLISQALELGMDKNMMIFDPGLGFGKTLGQNIQLICKIREIKDILGYPILIGASRKSFLKIMTHQTNNLDETSSNPFLPASLAALAASLTNGADIIRLHDINEAKVFYSLFNKLYFPTK